MRNLELEKIIRKHITGLYRYAYAVIPEELLAKQTVVDTTTSYFVKNKEYLEDANFKRVLNSKRKSFSNNMRRSLYRELWKLSKVRGQGIENLLEGDGLSMDLMQRSVLYLKDVVGLDWDTIMYIHEVPKHKLIEKLYQARDNISRFRGQDLEAQEIR